jgi:hypothetical protein
VRLLQWVFWPPVLAFGWSWDNSDDQFYVQLAVALGALAAGFGRRRRVVLGLAVVALVWNVADVAARRVLYPRSALETQLRREAAGSRLVVVPGYDAAAVLLTLDPRPGDPPVVSLATLAAGEEAEAGYARLAARIRSVLADGGRVVLIDLYDVPPQRNPWKHLERLGYTRAELHRALAAFPVEPGSRRAGPFRVRAIEPRPGLPGAGGSR